MTNWDRVEELRAKGLDWKAIAKDPRVGFTPPKGATNPGRALREAYADRDARAERRAQRQAELAARDDRKNWSSMSEALTRVGIVVVLAGAVWSSIAFLVPLVGALIPPFPDLAVATLVGIGLLGAGMVLGVDTAFLPWKKYAAVGIVMGLLAAGMVGLAAQSAGVPSLSASTTQEIGQGWEKAPNSVWSSGGLPVVFFYGSLACPYCAASSWAIYEALSQFGSLSGWSYAASNPSDVYPSTPEVSLVSVSSASTYLSLDVREGNDPQQITLPSLNAVEQAYVNAYNSGGGIPFLVVGGRFIHLGALVDPAALESGGTALTPQQVAQSLANANPSDPVYEAIHQAQLYLEAYFVKIDQAEAITPPSSVTGNSAVAAIVAQIT
jgi:hypothetical protein